MADTKQLKVKIAATKNIRKITSALGIISTLKLQKVKKKVEHLREYVMHLLEMVDALLSKGMVLYPPHSSNSKKTLIVVVSSDKGLCGSLNSQLFKFIDSQYANQKDKVDIYVIGKKAKDFFSSRKYNILGISYISDNINDSELHDVFSFLNAQQDSEYYYSIGVAYNFFKNTMKQIPVTFRLKPFTLDTLEQFLNIVGMEVASKKSRIYDIVLEPDEDTVKQYIRNMIVDYSLYSAILHNKTGEFAARMLAMKAAKDNASTIIDTTVLKYNKARQDAITQEVSEIVSAKAVIEN